MSVSTILALIFLLLPEPVLACVNHIASTNSAGSESLLGSFFNIILLLVVAFPVGLVVGMMTRRSSAAARTAIFIAIGVAGLLALGGHGAWACHGEKTVAPILQEVHNAQMDFHGRNGVYAASFEELDLEPSSSRYSYFLPSEMLSAKSPLPKEGVDLSRLPEGVFPRASADRFTVVALGFTEPNQINVWTMNQDRVFREWNVPVKIRSQKDQPDAVSGGLNGQVNKFDGALKWITFLLGLGAGFAFAARFCKFQTGGSVIPVNP